MDIQVIMMKEKNDSGTIAMKVNQENYSHVCGIDNATLPTTSTTRTTETKPTTSTTRTTETMSFKIYIYTS